MGKKIVKLTEEKFNKIITTAVEKVLNEVAMLGNFNENIKMTARLDEMARVGFINGEYEVYVWTDDPGNIPHVHIRDTNSKGQNFETCVQLKTNSYFLHGSYTDTLNSKQRKAFAEFMISPSRNKKYATNYEYAVDMWNDNNSNVILELEKDVKGNVIIPNYQVINFE